MVRKERLELSHLAAPEPKSGASTNFATSANLVLSHLSLKGEDGARGRIRTSDRLVRSQVLYPAELRAHWLGYLDSNQGMAASKAAALPLGDIPTEARIILRNRKAVNPLFFVC